MTRTVIVTGAARGIGLATTRLFISEGWQVAMVDRDGDELARAADPLNDAKPFLCDVSSPDAVEDMIARVQAWAGQLDALVNNAGVAEGTMDEDPELVNSYDLFSDVEGKYPDMGEQRPVDDDPMFSPTGENPLNENSQVKFHKDLTMLLFNEADIGAPMQSAPPSSKTEITVGIVGPFDKTSFQGDESTMAVVKKMFEEKDIFTASKHSLELAQKLHDIGALEIVHGSKKKS